MPRQTVASTKKTDAKPPKTHKKSHEQSAGSTSNADDRFQMISEAAYYRALGRGFDGGDPVEDWLEAESDIDRGAYQREESGVQSICS